MSVLKSRNFPFTFNHFCKERSLMSLIRGYEKNKLKIGMWKEEERRKLISSRSCKMSGGDDDLWKLEKDEGESEKFVKMMREAQSYFLAHRGTTFVVVLSPEIIDSSHLSCLLECPVTEAAQPCSIGEILPGNIRNAPILFG